MTRTARPDIYQTITANIVAAVEASPGDPVMPWQRGGFNAVLPSNAVTGNNYRGINILSLWVAALERGYEAGLFATYKQWASIGAQVRMGESAAPIVFYRELEIARESEGTDEGDAETVRMARGYWVFAAEQVDGFTAPNALPPDPIRGIAAADAYVTATGACVVSGGSRACYRPATDTIHMPDEARFFDGDGRTRSEAYYSVLGHELVHWSGAETRLKRTLGKRFGDDAYAMEECCAEIGAAFLCARLGIAHEPHPDHARYVHHWLKVMKADARAVFAAAARAQEAVTYLDGLQTPTARQSAAA
jgi:antirestriction protein ArdC